MSESKYTYEFKESVVIDISKRLNTTLRNYTWLPPDFKLPDGGLFAEITKDNGFCFGKYWKSCDFTNAIGIIEWNNYGNIEYIQDGWFKIAIKSLSVDSRQSLQIVIKHATHGLLLDTLSLYKHQAIIEYITDIYNFYNPQPLAPTLPKTTVLDQLVDQQRRIDALEDKIKILTELIDDKKSDVLMSGLDSL